jgi:hypothetical protein
MKLRVGQTLKSVVDATAVVVVRCPDQDVAVACGGREMSPEQSASQLPAVVEGPGAQLGKRYTAGEIDIELLCIKGGEHPVTVDGALLALKSAKPLPASD